jgi:HD-GYP domain-containing protein (c-di-GMP phosphodiesterase class II)
MNVLVSPSLPGEDNRFQLVMDNLPAENALRKACATGQVITSQDSEGVLKGLLPVGGNTYHVAVPILTGSQVTAIAGASGRADAYSEADLRQLSLLVGGLWQLIQQSQMLEALDESQMRLTAAVENLPFDFWIQDQNGRFVLQNQPSREAWGSLIGKNLDEDNLDNGVVEIWKGAVEKAASGRLVRAEITYPDRIDKGTYFNIVAPIWDGEEIRGTLGMNISIAALKQRERELAALVSIASTMRSAASQAEMRAGILDQAMDLLQIGAAALVRQDKSGEELHVELARGEWSESTGMGMLFPNPQAEDVFRAGEIHWSSKVSSDPLLSTCPLFKQMESGACIPLETRSGVQHALWVGSETALTNDQIHLLEAIADIAGSAIHRAELNEQTERHLQRMTALRAIDLAITSSLDVRLTLNILLSQIISQLNIDASDVLLFSPHTHQLEALASRGFAGTGMQGIKYQSGASQASQAALQRQQIFIPDLSVGDPQFLAEIRRQGEEFCSYLAQPLIAKGQVKGVLEIFHRTLLKPSNDWLDFLEAVSSQAAIAIDNAEMFDTLQRANTDLTVAYDATIEGWSRALELRDRETQGHTQRVTQLTVSLAESLGIKETSLVNIRRGVLLHDIGKMAIPDRILHKPGPLTTEEWEVMRRHPQYAQEMLSSIPYLRESIDIPYCHHERWDGSGYPRGIKDGQIPLAARLFTVVDIWDALTSDRPYRKAWPKDKVLTYLHEQAGKRLDPDLVDFFISHIAE